jgi:exopolysaccharide biosynthesis polyprenyl glycosylphosphotransferase
MIRLFRVFVPKVVVTVVIGDFLLTFACFLLGAWLILGDFTSLYLSEENGLRNILLAVPSVILGLYFQNLYSDFRMTSKTQYTLQVMTALGWTLIVQAMIVYINREFMLPRWIILASSGATILVLPLWRYACLASLRTTLGVQRLLFIGTDNTGIDLIGKLHAHPELGMRGIGFLSNAAPVGESIAGLPVLGGTSDLIAVIAREKPDRVVVNLSERRTVLPVETLLDLRFSGMRITEVGALFETAFSRVATPYLRPSHLIFAEELGPSPLISRLQTFYSFIIAAVGLIVSAPVMVLVAAIVKLTSPGPVLFSQNRVGLNGKIFRIYKFRSMVVDAEAGTGAVWARKNDPRVTPFGKVMRMTRLDELPQIFNVLRGDMSVVGPRPERPEFVNVLSEQIPFYRQRHAVKPGVTGWAQINYKYGETIEDTIVKLEYDLYYIKNLSPSLDFYIMANTLKVMLFSGHGQ